MKKILLKFIFFLTSCSSQDMTKNDLNFNFDGEMTLEEFKIKLDEYSKKKPYPNIDN